MNNEQNNLVRWTMNKIIPDKKNNPDSCLIIDPKITIGLIEDTAQLFKSSNTRLFIISIKFFLNSKKTQK